VRRNNFHARRLGLLGLFYGGVCTVIAFAGDGEGANDTIDWDAVGVYAPIPAQVPSALSEDPAEAGFPREWIERALPPTIFARSNLAVAIASLRRSPDDSWARAMESSLREIIRNRVTTATRSRVFCNSIGCLCYVERAESLSGNPIVYSELIRAGKQRFGIEPSDLDAATHSPKPGTAWELTVIKRPSNQ
jgi:hypothetical protein